MSKPQHNAPPSARLQIVTPGRALQRPGGPERLHFAWCGDGAVPVRKRGELALLGRPCQDFLNIAGHTHCFSQQLVALAPVSIPSSKAIGLL